ncbi:MAG: CvpA family protein [Parcubacteria group bacterium]|nr:CvpA family protein [Parcubacteria group bacterium]
MPILDIVLIIVLAGFTFYGLFFGLIRTLGSLVGLAAGLWLTVIFYLTVFGWVKNLFFGHELAGKIIVFIVLFTLINRLIGFMFALVDRTFDLLSVIPFLKTINRLAGAALGFVEGGLALGLILLFVSQTALAGRLDGSKIVPFLVSFARAVMPLLPGLLDRVKRII